MTEPAVETVAPQDAAAPAAAPVEAAPVVETPAAPAATLLQQFDAEAKTTEPPPAVEPANADDKPPVEAAAKTEGEQPKPEAPEPPKPEKPKAPEPLAPIAYEYTLPETVNMDEAQKSEVHKALDEFRADPAKNVQGLLNLHEKAMRDYATHLSNEQQRVWADTQKDWQNEVLADQQIGGAGHRTAMGAIARVRDALVPEKDRGAFETFLTTTGAGNHPAFLRMLHNAARFIDEPAPPPPNVNPPPDIGRKPGDRRATLYDHPTSNRMGR